MIGKILNVRLVSNGSHGLNGVIIEFETDDTIITDEIVRVKVDDEWKYFDIIEVRVEKNYVFPGETYNSLIGTAFERSCNSLLIERKAFDIRNLIDLEVEKVTDQNLLDNPLLKN